MKYKTIVLATCIALGGCSTMDIGNTISAGGSEIFQAATIKESDVINESKAAAEYMDQKNKVAPKSSKYGKRLAKLTKNIKSPEGTTLNFKVYIDKSANAFAMPDGTVRVNSGLMDKMNDQQVLAVIGHEIGHVVEKHSFNQMRKSLLTTAGVRVAASQSSASAAAYNSGMGSLTEKFFDAQYSKSDEISADTYAVKFLKEKGTDPHAMLEAIEVLQSHYGDGGGMLSSHPSNSKRIKNLKNIIK